MHCHPNGQRHYYRYRRYKMKATNGDGVSVRATLKYRYKSRASSKQL